MDEDCWMTMTMTHSGKVNQHQSEAWPHGHERRGHNPAKKSLLRLLCLALLARCATGTLLTTVCSHINRKKGTENTQAIAETNSSEFGRQGSRNPQIPDIKYNFICKRKVASSCAHQSSLRRNLAKKHLPLSRIHSS